MAKITILIVLLLLCTLIQGQISPCPQYFSYVTDPTTNKKVGQIEIPSLPKNANFRLKVIIKMGVNILPRYKAEYMRNTQLVQAQNSNEFAKAIEQGRPLLYYVRFPLHQPFPTLIRLRVNNQVYCTGPPPKRNIVIRIVMMHTFTLNSRNIETFLNSQSNDSQTSANDGQTSANGGQTSANDGQTSANHGQTSVSNKTINNNSNNECNIIQDVNVLISNGMNILPGQAPWLVGLFHVGTQYFRCAGFILTNRHIITAARCLKFSRYDSILPNMLEVAFGRFKLRKFKLHEINEYGMNTIRRAVANYKIHPDYMLANSSGSNLAILILRTPVEYNPFIKPIDLWSGSPVLRDVINKTGYFMGWDVYGNDERYTDEPRVASASIAECNSDHHFSTGNRSFCTTVRNDIGFFCSEVGTGLVLFDVDTGTYQLRGIVLGYLRDDLICNVTSIIYVDVAKFIPWIQEQIYQEIGITVRPTMPSQHDNKTNDNECGIDQHVGSNVNFRIFNGVEILPGRAPWLVALFIVRLQHEFQCVGSILTNRHIITAAHCLKFSLYSNDSIPPNVLEVALGRFKLHEFREHGTVNREVASYMIHPDYAHTNTADSDLAILILRMPVEYSPFIKPICLWSDSTILRNVVNRPGYIVGWGQDEHGRPYTEEPRMATVSIIDQTECLLSDQSFVHLSTYRTFCAGSLDNSIPCNGDSGSGLILFDAITSRYQLRGIVSRTIPMYNQSKLTCDPTKYTVYADVAQHIPWIQEQISTT